MYISDNKMGEWMKKISIILCILFLVGGCSKTDVVRETIDVSETNNQVEVTNPSESISIDEKDFSETNDKEEIEEKTLNTDVRIMFPQKERNSNVNNLGFGQFCLRENNGLSYISSGFHISYDNSMKQLSLNGLDIPKIEIDGVEELHTALDIVGATINQTNLEGDKVYNIDNPYSRINSINKGFMIDDTLFIISIVKNNKPFGDTHVCGDECNYEHSDTVSESYIQENGEYIQIVKDIRFTDEKTDDEVGAINDVISIIESELLDFIKSLEVDYSVVTIS